MTETAAIAGVTEEQLEALIGGGWVDKAGGTPGWERIATVYGRRRRVNQCVFPSHSRPEWVADSDGVREWLDSLEEALRWCDNRVDNVAASRGDSHRADQAVREVAIHRLKGSRQKPAAAAIVLMLNVVSLKPAEERTPECLRQRPAKPTEPKC